MIFTNDWFLRSGQKQVHEKFLTRDGKEIHILEIGSHEGRSTVFFSSYLSHPDSRLACIDPYLSEDTTSPVSDQTYKNFIYNIGQTGRVNQISLRKQFSQVALVDLIKEGELFDYILIDGSHLVHDVLTDGVLAFQVLKHGGIMFFDDYNGDEDPHVGVNVFLTGFESQVEVLHRGWHLVLRKKHPSEWA